MTILHGNAGRYLYILRKLNLNKLLGIWAGFCFRCFSAVPEAKHKTNVHQQASLAFL